MMGDCIANMQIHVRSVTITLHANTCDFFLLWRPQASFIFSTFGMSGISGICSPPGSDGSFPWEMDSFKEMF